MSSHMTSDSAKIMKPYGWLNTLYDIAKDHVFTYEGRNAIDSVLKTNLYKVFTYQSYKSSLNEFKNEAEKEIKRKTPEPTKKRR